MQKQLSYKPNHLVAKRISCIPNGILCVFVAAERWWRAVDRCEGFHWRCHMHIVNDSNLLLRLLNECVENSPTSCASEIPMSPKRLCIRSSFPSLNRMWPKEATDRVLFSRHTTIFASASAKQKWKKKIEAKQGKRKKNVLLAHLTLSSKLGRQFYRLWNEF